MRYSNNYKTHAPGVMALYRGHRFERLVLEKIESTKALIAPLGMKTKMERCMYKRLLIGLGATALPYILQACPNRKIAAEVLDAAATVAMHTGKRSAVIAAAEVTRRLINSPRLEDIVNELAKQAQSDWNDPSLAAENVKYVVGYYLQQDPRHIILYSENGR